MLFLCVMSLLDLGDVLMGDRQPQHTLTRKPCDSELKPTFLVSVFALVNTTKTRSLASKQGSYTLNDKTRFLEVRTRHAELQIVPSQDRAGRRRLIGFGKAPPGCI